MLLIRTMAATPVPPRLDRPARRHGLVGLLALLGLVGLWVLWHFDPAQSVFYPRCHFHELTGWLCPGCGGLRAMHALLHGRIAESWHYNPLPLLLVPAALLALAAEWYRRRRTPQRPWILSPIWAWASLAALLLFGVLRNIF